VVTDIRPSNYQKSPLRARRRRKDGLAIPKSLAALNCPGRQRERLAFLTDHCLYRRKRMFQCYLRRAVLGTFSQGRHVRMLAIYGKFNGHLTGLLRNRWNLATPGHGFSFQRFHRFAAREMK
jgi:hypothetical protein